MHKFHVYMLKYTLQQQKVKFTAQKQKFFKTSYRLKNYKRWSTKSFAAPCRQLLSLRALDWRILWGF